MHDIVIRGGAIVEGTGKVPIAGDLAIREMLINPATLIGLSAAAHICASRTAQLYRWKSSLVMKGEVVTHQLDCAVAALAASEVTCPALVATVRAS